MKEWHRMMFREVSGFWLAALTLLVLAGCTSSPRAPAPVETRGTSPKMSASVAAPAAETVKVLPGAENAGKPGYYTVQRGDTVQQMLDCPYYHPVLEEGLRSTLRQLQRALRMGPVPVERCLDCGPGA